MVSEPEFLISFRGLTTFKSSFRGASSGIVVKAGEWCFW